MSITPKSICDEAANLVSGERNKTYGDAYEQHKRAALLWQARIKAKYGIDIAFKAEDVCAMIRDVKDSRAMAGPFHKDNYVDGAGYFGLEGYCAHRERNGV